MLERLIQNTGRGLVLRGSKSIVHPFAFASRRDDSRSTKIGKMPRDLRLADAKDFDEVANADLAVGNEIQQAQTRWIGQGAEEQVERGIVLCFRHTPTIQDMRLDIYEFLA